MVVQDLDQAAGRVARVRVEGEQAPIFPEGCCVCDARVAESSLEIQERSRALSELVLPWRWIDSRWVKVLVPVCQRCRARLVARRRWRIVWMGSLVAVGVFGSMALAKPIGMTRGWLRFVGLVGGLLALAAGFAWYRVRPLPFDLRVCGSHVLYCFTSHGYAARFRACNPQ